MLVRILICCVFSDCASHEMMMRIHTREILIVVNIYQFILDFFFFETHQFILDFFLFSGRVFVNYLWRHPINVWLTFFQMALADSFAHVILNFSFFFAFSRKMFILHWLSFFFHNLKNTVVQLLFICYLLVKFPLAIVENT